MADPVSPLRTNRGAPTLFDQLSTSGQLSQQEQYALESPDESQFTKGLRTGAAGLTAGEFANEALRKEVAGNPAFTQSRDAALNTVRDTAQYAPRVSSLRQVNGVDDAVDFATGAIGQGAMSMAPAIAGAALTRGRGLGGKATAFAGAAVPAYNMERGEAALDQYQDPALMKSSAEERDLAASGKGLINAGLESIVPAGLGGALLRKPAGSLLGHVGREFVTEGATEAAQEAVGFGAKKYLDNSKQLDPMDLVDAFAAGGLTGGATSAALRGPAHAAQAVLDKAPGLPAMPELPKFGRSDAPAGPDEPVPGGAPTGDSTLGKVAGLGGAINERFGDTVRDGLSDAAAKAVDLGDQGIQKGTDIGKAAAEKTKDTVDGTLDRMTEAIKTAKDPADFMAQVFGGDRVDNAESDLSGDQSHLRGTTFEETESNIANDETNKAVRAAGYAEELLNDPATPERVREQINAFGGVYDDPDAQSFVQRTLVAQRGGEKIGKAVTDIIEAAKSFGTKAAGAVQDRIVKKNLQSASPVENAAFGKVVFDNLTDEAKANPQVRAQLQGITNGLMAFAAKTGDVTARDLPTLTKIQNAMSLFKDPDAFVQTLTDYAAVPREQTSFLARIKSIANAQEDIKQPNSFLQSSLTPEASRSMTSGMLKKVAQLVDQFTLMDADPKKGDAIVKGLATVMGGEDSARAVLDYYAQQNKADVRFDENETLKDPEGSFSEASPKASFRFKDAKTNRPFFNGSKDIDSARRDGTVGSESTSTPVTYDKYVAETSGDGEAEVKRIAKDIQDRIDGHKARKGEDRTDQIRALQGELSILNDSYVKGGAAEALKNYSVLRSDPKEQNDLVASDEDIKKYAYKSSGSRVTFKRTDGTKLMLSAESMWKSAGDKEGSGKGEGDSGRAKRLFKEAVASVLAREDVESLETKLEGLKLDEAGTEAAPKPDSKVYNDTLSALISAGGSLAETKAALRKAFVQFRDATNTKDGPTAESKQWAIRKGVETRIEQMTDRVAELEGTPGAAPALAVARERLLTYTRAKERLDDMLSDNDEVGGNTNTDDAEASVREGDTRLKTEMDTSRGARLAEEDTGTAVGSQRAPSMREPAKKDLPTPKPKPLSAKETREAAAKANNPRAPSTDAMTALNDVVVNENWSRLDTPDKVIKFTKLAKESLDHLNKTKDPKFEELHGVLKEMFEKNTTFDWDMVMTEVDGYTKQDLAAVHTLVGEEAIGTNFFGAKRSGMAPKKGRPGKIDQQAILDEITRIRGKGVKVAFAKFADIGASGEFSMNKNKTQRLIKIAVNSLAPMSVAWHESLHDFMAVLGGSPEERQVKADLLAAAEAPHVMKRLRELLAGHPDALAQIETDREERLAYMYQFWAEGALKVGPTGTNIFTRAARFFREALGVVSADQRIELLLDALHTGKFAEPSLVPAALADLKANTLGQRAKEISGPIGEFSESLLTGATDRLRNTNVDALTELADLFHREPGREGGSLPFMQRRAQQVGKRLNELQDILDGSTAVERRSALDNLQAMKPPSTPLEKAIAGWLKNTRDYMVDKGVKRFDAVNKVWGPFGNVSGYFPRVWDKEVIRNKEQEYIAALSKYIPADQARKTFDAIVNGDGSLELAENEHSLGFTPWNPAVQNREFTFINKANAAEFTDFQVKDLTEILTSYAQRAVHRAEYAATFGNAGELIAEKLVEAQEQGATAAELAMAQKATMAMEGTLGYDFNPRIKEVMSGIMTFENVVLLPMALFSSLIDPLGVAMRSNDMKEAWNAFKSGMKGIADAITKAGPDEEAEMARLLGLIDDQNMLDAMGQVYNSMHMSRFLKKVNSTFFKFNGMELWNQRMRVSAMMAAQRFIVKNIDNKRYMDELGIDHDDVFELADGTIALTKDQIIDAIGGGKYVGKRSLDEVEKRIQQAVFKFVDGAVLRPNAAHRPIWGSDPRFALVFHLKQFTFSFQQTILARVSNELTHGNVAPALILATYVPFMFLSDVMKGSLTGTLNTTADLYDIASRSIARSGILGTGVFADDAWSDVSHGNVPGTSFLGPAFDHISALLSTLMGHSSAGQLVDRSVPFAKYL